jgi:PAS domain S-box-containing protein
MKNIHSAILKVIIDGVNGPVFSLDTNYCYTSFNRIHADLMKILYNVDIEEGRSLLDYQTSTVDREKAKKNIDKTLSGEYVKESAWSGDDKDTRRYFEVFHTPVLNDQGVVMGVVVNAIDLTENLNVEEKLRETNEYLNNLFNYANAPIIVWDTSLIVTRFNPAFELLSGYTRDEVIGKDISVLFSKEKAGSSVELIKRAVSGERWEVVEIEIQRKDGRKRIVLWNSANILGKDGKTVVETIAQGNDITERKSSEAKIATKVKELELFNNLMVGREIRMVELKKEINRLLKISGEPEKYTIHDSNS